MRLGRQAIAALEPEARALAVRAALLAARRGGRAYLVGGAVRDALLSRPRADLDLALELAPAEAAARYLRALARELAGELALHPAFGTGSVTVGEFRLDVAMTRRERYPHPASLPRVTPAGLRDDLTRRDFRINALAAALPPAPPALIDPLGGRADLDAGVLRSIHPASLRDDPSRAVRGARLATRLDLAFAPEFEREVEAHLVPKVLARFAYPRRRAELELTLDEPEPGAVLATLARCGALEPFFELRLGAEVGAALARLDRDRDAPDGPDGADDADRGADRGADSDPKDAASETWRGAYPLLWLQPPGPRGGAEAWCDRFGYPRALARSAERVGAAVREARRAPSGAAELALRWNALGPAERRALRALVPEREAEFRALAAASGTASGTAGNSRERRELRGSDVIGLGLPEGPEVGRILRRVARARAAGRTRGFDEELALGRELVAAARAGALPPDDDPSDRDR